MSLSRPSPEYWVKKNSGADLIQSINAYGLERDIRLPTGTYLTDSIIAASDLNLKGRGCFKSIIKANSVIDEILNVTGHSQLRIKGVGFDCDGKATNGIKVNNNAGDAILDAIIKENLIKNALGYGLVFNQPVGSHQVGNIVKDNWITLCNGGIYANTTDSLFKGNYVNALLDNHVADAYESGIIVFRGANRLILNYLGGGYCHGIYVYATNGTIIESNIVDHWWMHGIVLRGASETTINGGKVTTCGRAATHTYSGIRLESSGVPTPCTYNDITGVTIETDAAPYDLKYGIEEVDANQDYNKFNHCILKGVFGTAAVLKQGAHSQDNT